MTMRVILSNASGLMQYILPAVLDEQPVFNGGDCQDEVYKTVNGNIKLIDRVGLESISIDSFFPVDKYYPFVAFGSLPDGWEYVNWLKSAYDKRTVIRAIVIGSNKKTAFNKLCTVDEFSYFEKSNKDIKYSLKLVEFGGDVWESLRDAINNVK